MLRLLVLQSMHLGFWLVVCLEKVLSCIFHILILMQNLIGYVKGTTDITGVVLYIDIVCKNIKKTTLIPNTIIV